LQVSSVATYKPKCEPLSVLTSTMVRFRFSIPAVFSFRFFSSSSRTFKNDRLAGSVKRLTAREMAKNCRATGAEVEGLVRGWCELIELGYRLTFLLIVRKLYRETEQHQTPARIQIEDSKTTHSIRMTLDTQFTISRLDLFLRRIHGNP
jgi:hypothetical protein